jgi:hypothetical protein
VGAPRRYVIRRGGTTKPATLRSPFETHVSERNERVFGTLRDARAHLVTPEKLLLPAES